MSDPFIGEIRMFGGNFAPVGWALCDGSLLSTNDFNALFSLLGTTYGGNGRTQFGLPDLRGRLPIHAGDGLGLTSRHLGAKGGFETVALTAAEIPVLKAAIPASSASGTTQSPAGAYLAYHDEDINGYHSSGGTGMAGDSIRINGTGNGTAHNNMQPFLCINFIIAHQGTYPSRH